MKLLATLGLGFKMSCKLGLWIGDSFAELRGLSVGSTYQARWLLSKKSIAEGLNEALMTLKEAGETSGELRLVTSRSERVLERRQGGNPAFLVTVGFEQWARLRAPLQSPPFALPAERGWFPVSDEMIFPVNERTLATGQVMTAPDLAELETIVTKLQALKVRDVALGFVNSLNYPENEQQVERFLNENGLQVIASHRFAIADEATRWKRACEAAYTQNVVQEELAQITSAMADWKHWTLSTWGEGGSGAFELADAATLAAGEQNALAYAFDQTFPVGDCPPLLHFGLESFYVVSRDQTNSVVVKRLGLQPTQVIQPSSWSTARLTEEERGYEPGPMLFGKSHQLTVLDVLFLQGKLSDPIDGITERINDRGRTRILETLFTFGKTIADRGNRTIEAPAIAEDLELAIFERLAGAVSEALVINASGIAPKISVSGPLTQALLPSLEKRRLDVKFARTEKFESLASLVF